MMNDLKRITQLNQEKKLKSKLVNIRKIIQDKFRKVKRDRIKQENVSNEKYKPITQAISKLKERTHSSADEFDWGRDIYSKSNFSPMDYNSFSESDGDQSMRSIRHKKSRLRDDDSIELRRKKSRLSHPRKLSSKKLKRRLNQLKNARKIRAEAKMKSLKQKSPQLAKLIQSKQDQPDDAGFDKSDDGGDLFVHSNDQIKRLRLEKSALDKSSEQMRLKNNKKILEMRKVDDILMGVKDKAIADSLNKRDNIIDISSDGEFRGEKKSNVQSQKSKPSSPYELRPSTLKQLDHKKVPETIAVGTTLDEYIAMASGKPISHKYVPIVKDTPHSATMKRRKSKEKKAKDDETKGGGSIEADFIPYNENIVHEFYDDPNELCDRLRLLIASRTAGNSNHSQEINSIISELREVGVIF